MTRVLMTADAAGGVWTYALELARAHAADGVSTTLALMGPRPSPSQLIAAHGIPGLEIVTSDFQLEWMEAPWDDVAAAGRWLLELESRVQPTVIHLNGYAHGALPWHAPVVVVGHSCVLSWRDAVGGDFDARWLDRYRRTIGEGLRAADWVVTPSRSMLSSLKQHYGPLPRSSIIFNGRSADRFHRARKEPFVFTAGRLWDRAKNIEGLRSIAPYLSWPVVAAGDSPRAADLMQVGRLSESEMADWLARAAIFALPARYEPFGLSAVEAALSGCALVLGDIASQREIWGDAADFVDPDDHDALWTVLDRLIEDDALRHARAAAAHKRAARFNPMDMARNYIRVYGQIAATSRRRRFACVS